MKKILLSIAFVAISLIGFSQTLTIDTGGVDIAGATLNYVFTDTASTGDYKGDVSVEITNTATNPADSIEIQIRRTPGTVTCGSYYFPTGHMMCLGVQCYEGDVIPSAGKKLYAGETIEFHIQIQFDPEGESSEFYEIYEYGNEAGNLVSFNANYLSPICNVSVENVVNSFSINLSSLNTSMSDFTMSDNWLEKMTDSTSNMLNSARASLGNIIEDRNSSNNNDKMYKVITTILATTTNVLAPAIELLIVVLPDLLRGLFEGNQQKKQKEQIQNTILTQVIPSLKIELRSKLPEIFNQQVQEMISNISDKFEDTIEEKKQVIEATQKEINEKQLILKKPVIFIKKLIAMYLH